MSSYNRVEFQDCEFELYLGETEFLTEACFVAEANEEDRGSVEEDYYADERGPRFRETERGHQVDFKLHLKRPSTKLHQFIDDRRAGRSQAEAAVRITYKFDNGEVHSRIYSRCFFQGPKTGGSGTDLMNVDLSMMCEKVENR